MKKKKNKNNKNEKSKFSLFEAGKSFEENMETIYAGQAVLDPVASYGLRNERYIGYIWYIQYYIYVYLYIDSDTWIFFEF